MKNTLPCWMLAVALAITPCVSYAGDAVVVLKNGASMKGTVVAETANFLTMNINGSNVNVLKSIIATINGAPYTPGAPPAAVATPAPAAPSPAPSPQTGATFVDVSMQDGTLFSGTLVSENANFMNINTGAAEIKVLKSNIAGIKRSTTTATTAPSKPVPAESTPVTRPSVPPAPQPAQPMVAKPTPPAPAGAEKSAAPQPSPSITPGDHSIALKNGTQFKGPIVMESANFITFSINGSKVNILKSIISSLDGKPYNPLAPEQTAAPVAAPVATPAPVNPAPTPVEKPTQPIVAHPSKPEPFNPSASASPSPSPAPSQAPAPGAKYGPMAPLQPKVDTKPVPIQPVTQMPAAAPNSPQFQKQPSQKSEPALPPASPQVQEQMKYLAMQEREKQIQAALQLKTIGPPAASAIPQLIEMLGSEVQPLDLKNSGKKTPKAAPGAMTPARAAVTALISIGTASVEPLTNALTIRNYGVRANACFALGELKDPRSVDGLFVAMRDSFAEVRANASEALGKIRDPRAIPLLVTMLGADTSEAVINATQISLNNLTDIPTLIASLKDPSKVVRENVAYILFLMTAKDFRANPSQWEIWWEEQQSGGTQTPAPAASVPASTPAVPAPAAIPPAAKTVPATKSVVTPDQKPAAGVTAGSREKEKKPEAGKPDINAQPRNSP